MEYTYWTSIVKKIFFFVFTLVLIIIALKLSVFYMPFVIAFAISMLIEPGIKRIMNKFKLSRKISSMIVFILVFGTILGILVWGIVTVISEASNLLYNFNEYYEKMYEQIQNILKNFNFDELNIPSQIAEIIENATVSLIQKVSMYLQGFLTNLIRLLTSIPTIGIYFGVTVLAIYFICTDKIYMIDELEHHLPEKWVKQIVSHLKEISSTLGGYLKAQLTLIGISFILSLIGLYIMAFAGLNVGFPLLIAIGIAFVDALPILGSGTAMVPWAIISALNGELTLGICIVVLWIIMSITRQFIEPKIVSGNIRNTSNFYNNCNVYRF